MKKLIPTIVVVLLFTLVFLFFFRSCASATELGEGNTGEENVSENESMENTEDTQSKDDGNANEEFDLKLYIQERIMPVVVGVITGIAGLISTIVSIKRSIRSLNNLKNSFSEEKAQREASLADNKKLLQEEVSRLQTQTKDLPEMKETIDELRSQIGAMGEMLQLAFSANAELVKTGKAKKMSLLLDKIKPKEEKSNDEATI